MVIYSLNDNYTPVAVSPDMQAILNQVWYPTTVCSQSRAQKLMLARVIETVCFSACHTVLTFAFIFCSIWMKLQTACNWIVCDPSCTTLDSGEVRQWR